MHCKVVIADYVLAFTLHLRFRKSTGFGHKFLKICEIHPPHVRPVTEFGKLLAYTMLNIRKVRQQDDQ